MVSSKAATVAAYLDELPPERRDEIATTSPAEFIALYERVKPPVR